MDARAHSSYIRTYFARLHEDIMDTYKCSIKEFNDYIKDLKHDQETRGGKLDDLMTHLFQA